MSSSTNGIEELRRLLERQKARAGEEGQVDWAEVKTSWVEATLELVERVEKWLHPLATGGLLTVTRRWLDLDEENLGPYRVPGLSIRAPSGSEVLVRASARLVLGAEGRVDIVSGSRTATLLRKGGGWQWAIRRGGELELRDFDEQSFLSVLGEMLR